MIVVEEFTIVSGGQTGADRAALDWAIARGIPHGGWCPAGRMAEDGVIPTRFRLTEMPDGGGYLERTRANVADSDATLIVSLSPRLSGGSLATADFAKELRKPRLHVHPGSAWRKQLANWLHGNRISALNIAGPRASGAPGVDIFVWEVLDAIIPATGGSPIAEPASVDASRSH
jgi:hypothetical protein